MRQKKNRKKKKNRKIRILTGVVLGVGLAGALFFNVLIIREIFPLYIQKMKSKRWSRTTSG